MSGCEWVIEAHGCDAESLRDPLKLSHLFDSLHGWLYVFGFGVAGGMALRRQADSSTAGARSGAS